MATTTERAPEPAQRRRLRDRLLPSSERGFALLAGATLFAIWVNIASGAWVRVTGSGLGCPDWPTCHGGAVPPSDYHAQIEFSNRVVATIGVALAVVAYFAARRLHDRTNSRLALASALLILAQVPLGGLTVATDLNPWLVISHFLLAMVVAALAAALWSRASLQASDKEPRSLPDWVRLAAVGLIAAAALLIVTGALVTASGPHTGGNDHPIDRLWNISDAVYVHVRAAFAFAALLGVLLLALRRPGRRPPGYHGFAIALLVLVPLQIALGEYQWRNQLPTGVVLVHVAVAGALWMAVVAFATRALVKPAP